jgi:hypothetical protein
MFVAQSGDVPLAVLWNSINQGLLHLANGRSLLLVVIGISLSVVAVIDVATIGDPYPGYGRLGRRTREAIDDYGDRRTECIVILQQLRDAAVAQMTQVIESVRSREHEVALSVNGRTRLYQQYLGFIEHLYTCYTRLTQRYREANIRRRTTAAPLRFASEPPPLPALSAPPELPALAPDRDAMAYVVERMEFFIREIRNEFETQAARYPAITELLGQREENSNAPGVSV